MAAAGQSSARWYRPGLRCGLPSKASSPTLLKRLFATSHPIHGGASVKGLGKLAAATASSVPGRLPVGMLSVLAIGGAVVVAQVLDTEDVSMACARETCMHMHVCQPRGSALVHARSLCTHMPQPARSTHGACDG